MFSIFSLFFMENFPYPPQRILFHRKTEKVIDISPITDLVFQQLIKLVVFSIILQLITNHTHISPALTLDYTQHGAARADVHTVAVSSRLDAIRSVYGLSVARSLIKIDVSDNDLSSSVFEMDGFISNSNYIAKKITMVLYINGRYQVYCY